MSGNLGFVSHDLLVDFLVLLLSTRSKDVEKVVRVFLLYVYVCVRNSILNILKPSRRIPVYENPNLIF